MNKLFVFVFAIIALVNNIYAQRSSSPSESPCDTSPVFFLINIGDALKKNNQHYYQIIEQNCIVYSDPLRRDFKFTKKADLIPRHFSSPSPSDFMVKFEMTQDNFNKISQYLSIEMTIELSLNRTLISNGADSTMSFELKFNFSKNSFINIGKVYFYSQFVPIAYPENLTIPAISLDIHDKLSGLQFYYDSDTSTSTKDDPMNWRFKEVYIPCSHQDSAYVRAIKLLDALEFHKTDTIKLKIEQIDDLLQLYLFTKEYLTPGSFYKEEATKLSAAVSVMEFERGYLENDSLLTLLRISKNSLDQYEQKMEELRAYHVRSKIVLFSKGVLPKPDQDEYILLHRKEYNWKVGHNNNTSFGAFVVPARLRLNTPSQFSNDLTIGVSFHQSFLKKPALDIVVGLGLSAVTVDSLGGQKDIRMAAFTQMVGIAYAPMGKHFQLGLFLGLDIGRLPEHQTIPWIGLGAAYRLQKQKNTNQM
jgi:hypothetical protein